MIQRAGSTLVLLALFIFHFHTDSCMVADIAFGETLPTGAQSNRGDFPASSITAPLMRAGCNTMRVCVLHLDNKAAPSKVGLSHEALGTMFLDCLHYQKDLSGGDATMSLYRAAGSKQESIDRLRGGMYQRTRDYFLEAWTESLKCMPMCYLRVQHVSAKRLCLLKQCEDQFPIWPSLQGLRAARLEYNFLVWIQSSPPSWSGDIQWMMINGLKHLLVGWNTNSAFPNGF